MSETDLLSSKMVDAERLLEYVSKGNFLKEQSKLKVLVLFQ